MIQSCLGCPRKVLEVKLSISVLVPAYVGTISFVEMAAIMAPPLTAPAIAYMSAFRTQIVASNQGCA